MPSYNLQRVGEASNLQGNMTEVMADNSGKVMAVVLGWWNARPEHVKKYKLMWESFPNTHAFAYTARSHVSFSGRVITDIYATTLLQRILRECKDKGCTQIIFHSFSNNGCLMYQSLMRCYLKINVQEVKVAGAVFDSCPGKIALNIFYGAVMAAKVPTWTKAMYIAPLPLWILYRVYITHQKHAALSVKNDTPIQFGKVATELCSGILVAMASYFGIINLITYIYQAEHIKLIRASLKLNKFHAMYLYSKEDHLVTYDQIELVVGEIESAEDPDSTTGNNSKDRILMHLFSGSGHCAHYMMHPDEYRKQCEIFLSKIKS